MGWLFRLALIVCVAYTGCAPVGSRSVGIDQYGCDELPPDTFTAAGVDAHFAQSTFGKIVTGDIDIKTQPSVVSLASEVARNARARDRVRCLALRRDKFKPAQTIYLDDTNAFLETKPSPEDFIKWKQQNPFPEHSDEQINILEREVTKLRAQATKSDQELRILQERQKSRHLTLAQRSSLVSAWSKTDKGEISIDFMAADGESEAFARDLAEALRMSGWTVTRVGPLVPFGTSTPIGLRLLVRDRETPEVRGLISGFDHVGLKGEVLITPKANPPIQLWVGNKP